MPDVPNVPGVPPLVSFGLNTVVLIIEDLVQALGIFAAPQWGIFLDGEPAFDAANSTVTFEFKRDARLPTYPVEDGGFQNYDKVQLPFDVRVKLASGSSEADRQDLLNQVDDAYNSLDLYDIVTPEKVFQSCNLHHYDFRRSSENGVTMIIVDCWFEEIRVTSTANFTDTQQPGGASAQSAGNVQPQTLSDSANQQFQGSTVQ